ncbi:hypothetical protein BDV96DRAFT_503601 [Lophiotrema nucula]|uniref:HAD-like domain-containing protein n=1 Tax=Lophiotrema nucula TaxID=690887 RepID=A0A6A5YS64_9PLEO|nr:hypothetical protein BDV96DRAFT_503601 [Lophiotrema nucula]
MSTKCGLDPYRAIHFILDFDGTLTHRDTLEQLVQVAKDSTGDRERTDNAWTKCKEAYLEDRANTMKTINLSDSTTVEGESAILKDLEPVETRSVDRVSKSGIFQGLTEQHILDGAAQQREKPNGVRLRNGVREVLDVVNSRRERLRQDEEGNVDDVSILSVNWSQTWIYGCLKSQLDNFEEYNIYKTNICSNELEGLKVSMIPSNGVITGGIFSSRNKLERLTHLRRVSASSGSRTPVIYVGDSWTDLECLIDAELGICIGKPNIETSELAQSFKRIGIKCPHISKLDECDDWNVVWARDFAEIATWLSHNS